MEKFGLTPKVLVVSNHQTTGPLWVFSIKQQNLEVVLEPLPANTIQRWSEEIPDLIVFDINLPENQILELLQKLRAETNVPILLLTSPKNEDFLLETYQAGVDETLFKPINPSLLLAKIKVWLRRAWTVPADTLDPLKVGKIQLLPCDRTVRVNHGNPIRLTNLEMRLLYYLMNRAGHTVTVEELNQRIWGYITETDATMLKNVVYRLRRKIEEDPANPRIIQTGPGVGYRLIAE